jgi:hypothetical protein
VRARRAIVTAVVLCAPAAMAADPLQQPPPTDEQIEAAIKADAQRPAGVPTPQKTEEEEEAPPPPPRHKGIVVESSLGALGFLGEMRHLSPTAPWMHLQVGYEFFDWLMLFAEGELAFTDTTVSQETADARAFPIFGLGGGLRATIHITDRVALYGQGALGALKADIAKNALAILGFHDAESLNVQFGGRIGVEWYQLDRHLALGAAFGFRDATGFAKAIGKDSPLMWDGSAVLRYTF